MASRRWLVRPDAAGDDPVKMRHKLSFLSPYILPFFPIFKLKV
jgi:hypothetical protein